MELFDALALESGGGGTQDNADVARPPRDGVCGRRGYFLVVYIYIHTTNVGHVDRIMMTFIGTSIKGFDIIKLLYNDLYRSSNNTDEFGLPFLYFG